MEKAFTCCGYFLRRAATFADDTDVPVAVGPFVAAEVNKGANAAISCETGYGTNDTAFEGCVISATDSAQQTSANADPFIVGAELVEISHFSVQLRRSQQTGEPTNARTAMRSSYGVLFRSRDRLAVTNTQAVSALDIYNAEQKASLLQSLHDIAKNKGPIP